MEVAMSKSFKSYSDQELIQHFAAYEQWVIRELISRYQSKIYTSIYIMVKDKYLAEDIYQETFIKIFTTLRNGKYADQGKFLPWAMRIAHNLCIDYFRKVKQQVKVTLQDGTDILTLFPALQENAEQKTIREQSDYILQRLVDDLPQEQKEVILMRIYGDMSFKEIARVTGVSINTALGRMRYGLMNLKKTIAVQQINIR